jgi:hypothetical protein
VLRAVEPEQFGAVRRREPLEQPRVAARREHERVDATADGAEVPFVHLDGPRRLEDAGDLAAHAQHAAGRSAAGMPGVHAAMAAGRGRLVVAALAADRLERRVHRPRLLALGSGQPLVPGRADDRPGAQPVQRPRDERAVVHVRSVLLHGPTITP